MIEEDEKWRSDGACVNCDPELFFPVGVSEAAIEQETQAVGVCESCPVKTPCLELALKTRQDSGVWGGKTERERRDILNVYHRKHSAKRSRTVGEDIQNGYYSDVMKYIDLD